MKIEIIRSESPTCSTLNLRVVTALAASKRWKINLLDIQSAYLQGQEHDRNVFLKPPPEANTDKIWHLRKCVYGLNEAARIWYLHISRELISLQIRWSYFFSTIAGTSAWCYVNDFFWSGTDWFKFSVINRQNCNISNVQHEAFEYFDIHINQVNEDICLNQSKYEDFLESMQLKGSRNKNRKSNKTRYTLWYLPIE